MHGSQSRGTRDFDSINKAIRQRAINSDLKDDLIEKVKVADLREIYFVAMEAAITKLTEVGSISDSEAEA